MGINSEKTANMVLVFGNNNSSPRTNDITSLNDISILGKNNIMKSNQIKKIEKIRTSIDFENNKSANFRTDNLGEIFIDNIDKMINKKISNFN